MNIYFACSITGGREFEPAYQSITRALLEDGHAVPTAHLAGADVKALEAVVSPVEVYERDAAWIEACDVLIAEVSTPSHGVGYEIAFNRHFYVFDPPRPLSQIDAELKETTARILMMIAKLSA